MNKNDKLEQIFKVGNQVRAGQVLESEGFVRIAQLAEEGAAAAIEAQRITGGAMKEIQTAVACAIREATLKYPDYTDEIWVSRIDVDGQYYSVRIDVSNLFTTWYEVNTDTGYTCEKEGQR